MRLIGRWLLTDIFAEIKNRVPLRQAAEDYGIQVERNSKAHCPFHGEDKHPSMKLYPDRFMCFTCNEHGDVITLVAKLLGIPLLDAAKELNDRYALGLTIGRASNAAERQKQREEAQQRRQKQELKQAFREWKTYAWEVLSRYYRLLNHWREQYAPRSPSDLDTLSPNYLESMKQDYIGYCLDILDCDQEQAKIHFYISHWNEVNAIAKRLQQLRDFDD